MSRVKLGVGLAVIAGAAMAAFLLVKRRAPEADAATKVTTAVATPRDLELVAEAAGLIEAVRVVEVKSKAAGEVLRVDVDTGDRVEQGTVLAEIDPRDVQSALEQAQADLESAKVKAQVTTANRARMESLRATQTVTQQEYEASVEGAAAARAAVVRDETSLRLAHERRNDVIIKAPISGTILSRAVQPGQIIASATSHVSGGIALFTMADLAQMQVRAKVDESDIGRIAVDQQARVTVEAYPGRTFKGRVAKIEPQAVVEQNVTLFPVLILLDNKEGLLRPGMNGEAQIEIARRQNALSVPSSAVVSMRDATSAAQALGLEPEQVRGLMRGPGSSASDGGAGDDACAALREQLRAAGGFDRLTDAQRAELKACRERSGGGRAARGAGGGAGDIGSDGRPGIVFVRDGEQVQPRRVLLGLSDWEHTEIVDGLKEGEEVVLVSVVQLQKEQQRTSERMRQRSGGIVPGSGGSRSGGGGGGARPSGGPR